jgi:hypothetical protein
MYAVLAQIYWPVWIAFAAMGYSAFGMFAGIVAVFASWSLAWRIEFKTWKFWKGV